MFEPRTSGQPLIQQECAFDGRDRVIERREAGGIAAVAAGHGLGRTIHRIGLRLEFQFGSGQSGHYAFQFGTPLPRGSAQGIQHEECVLQAPGSLAPSAYSRISAQPTSQATTSPITA